MYNSNLNSARIEARRLNDLAESKARKEMEIRHRMAAAQVAAAAGDLDAIKVYFEHKRSLNLL